MSVIHGPTAVLADQSENNDNATNLMAIAHSNINQIDSITQLKTMQKTYNDYYKILEGKADNDAQRAIIKEQRDQTDEIYDSRIDELQTSKRHRRSNTWLRKIGRAGRRVVRNIGKGALWTGKQIDQSIRIVLKTTIRTLPNSPEKIAKFLITTALTGGTSSLKTALKNMVKTNVKRQLKSKAYTDLAKIAYRNKILRAFLEANDFTDNELRLNPEFQKKYKEYVKEQEAKRNDGQSDDNSPDAAYEGEGGYDSDDGVLLFEQMITYAKINEYYGLELAGTYTLESFNARVPSIEYYVNYFNNMPDYYKQDPNSAISDSIFTLNDRILLSSHLVGLPIKDGPISFYLGQSPDLIPENEALIYGHILGFAYTDDITDLTTIPVFFVNDETSIDTLMQGEIITDKEWSLSPEKTIFETIVTIDENNFFYIKGTCTILNDCRRNSFEYEDYAPTSAEHLLDYTFSFDFKSVDPLNFDLVNP
jgi:hypothetical protein